MKVKNEYGGYIVRELIEEETIYNIILSSESEISKKFKKDVSRLLCKLRENKQLTVTNDKLDVVRDNVERDERVTKELEVMIMENE
jgi:hypothetical protein